jgi:hypothetical protein
VSQGGNWILANSNYEFTSSEKATIAKLQATVFLFPYTGTAGGG